MDNFLAFIVGEKGYFKILHTSDFEDKFNII